MNHTQQRSGSMGRQLTFLTLVIFLALFSGSHLESCDWAGCRVHVALPFTYFLPIYGSESSGSPVNTSLRYVPANRFVFPVTESTDAKVLLPNLSGSTAEASPDDDDDALLPPANEPHMSPRAVAPTSSVITASVLSREDASAPPATTALPAAAAAVAMGAATTSAAHLSLQGASAPEPPALTSGGAAPLSFQSVLHHSGGAASSFDAARFRPLSAQDVDVGTHFPGRPGRVLPIYLKMHKVPTAGPVWWVVQCGDRSSTLI